MNKMQMLCMRIRDNSRRLQPRDGAKELNAQLNGKSATEYVATVSVGHVGATHSPLLAHPHQMHQQPNL
ncbi:hypothetical protein F511_18018 [Dorcoceras hygrometricum]|uniref:Uncharacterized protein n=1 Tax=Dorcoceras hygrometricum TaxID=472368 RepID=A0A2Z7AR22_9LAMI|nr:hypothetical protein F511_18018 [Dorcoceras hygrometricum]